VGFTSVGRRRLPLPHQIGKSIEGPSACGSSASRLGVRGLDGAIVLGIPIVMNPGNAAGRQQFRHCTMLIWPAPPSVVSLVSDPCIPKYRFYRRSLKYGGGIHLNAHHRSLAVEDAPRETSVESRGILAVTPSPTLLQIRVPARLPCFCPRGEERPPRRDPP